MFKGLGCIKNVVYDMKMKHETKPIVNPPCKVSHQTLNCSKDEPTEWVNSLVIVEKKSGDLRLCIDPRSLNQGIQREHYPMRTVKDVAACLAGQAFYQIRVTEASSRLLTFNSAFGRIKYTHMPFGISSASKVWERTITGMFDDIPGVEVILIAGKDVEEHDAVLRKVLDRALEKGLGLNSEKCRIAVDSVIYQGHIFSDAGVKVDPAKVSANRDFPTPENVDNVTRWLGMVTYVGKFISNLAEKAAPFKMRKPSGIGTNRSRICLTC